MRASRRPWDVAVAAALLAVLGVAAVLIPPETLLLNYPQAYNAVFGVGHAVLLYWVLLRLWLLARHDGGPATLVGAALVLSFIGTVYTELWNSLVFGRPFQEPLDLTIAFVHVASGALLAIAFLRWSRMPSWLGGLLVAQVAVEAIESSSALMLLGDLPVTLGGILWTVFLVALTVVLLTPDTRHGEDALAVDARGI